MRSLSMQVEPTLINRGVREIKQTVTKGQRIVSSQMMDAAAIFTHASVPTLSLRSPSLALPSPCHLPPNSLRSSSLALPSPSPLPSLSLPSPAPLPPRSIPSPSPLSPLSLLSPRELSPRPLHPLFGGFRERR